MATTATTRWWPPATTTSTRATTSPSSRTSSTPGRRTASPTRPGPSTIRAWSTHRFAAIFDKGAYAAAYSGFEGTSADGEPLADWLRSRGVDRVDVCGIAADYCVKATAIDASRHDFTTTVLLDLTAAVDPTSTDAVVGEMAAAGVTVATPA